MDVMFETLTKILVAFSVSLSLFLLVCLYLSCSLCAFTNACVYIQGRNNTRRAAPCYSKPNSQSTN